MESSATPLLNSSRAHFSQYFLEDDLDFCFRCMSRAVRRLGEPPGGQVREPGGALHGVVCRRGIGLLRVRCGTRLFGRRS